MKIQTEIQTAAQWHIIKNNQQLGPFKYEEMIHMLQNNTLHNYEYAWAPHLEKWTVISSLNEFSNDRILNLFKNPENNNFFERRQSARIRCQLYSLVHNNNYLWKGEISSLSEGGALIAIDNPLLLPGDEVTIHFRKNPVVQSSINMKANIITKQFMNQKFSYDSKLQYAVKFSNQENKQIKNIMLSFEKGISK